MNIDEHQQPSDQNALTPNQDLALANPLVGSWHGLLMFLTMGIPWGIYGGKPLWFWKLFHPRVPMERKVMLVAVWVIGLSVFCLSLKQRGARLVLAYLLAGGTGLGLYLVATHASLAPWLSLIPASAQWDWMPLLSLVSIFLLLLVLSISSRASDLPGLSVLRFAIAALVLALQTIPVLEAISSFQSQDSFLSLEANLPAIVAIIGGSSILLGCLMAQWNAASLSGVNRNLFHSDRCLVLTGLLLISVWRVLRPGIEKEQLLAILGPLNNLIVTAGIATICLEGLTGAVTWLAIRASDHFSRKAPAMMRQALTMIAIGLLVNTASAGDWPQWRGHNDGNGTSDEKSLPDRFEGVSGGKTSGLAGVKWVVPLGAGTGTYGSPIVAGGKVFIGGTSRGRGRDNPLGMLWCFRESDGELLWRLQSPYRANLYNRSFGICATPTADGDRIYLLNHIGDVLCLHADGLGGGNRGVFKDEVDYFATDRKVMKSEIAPDGHRRVEWNAGTPAVLGPVDADILWRFDLIRQADCWPFNALSGGMLVRGDCLYVPTCSTFADDGASESGRLIDKWKVEHGKASYDSPGLIVLDKNTGSLLAREREGIFNETFHGAQSTPALGTVAGRELLVYGSGGGTCYAFDPQIAAGTAGQPGQLKCVWKMNCNDPATFDVSFALERTPKVEIIGSPVIDHDRVYVLIGNDLRSSGSSAPPGRLICIDATRSGDITRTGKIWSYDEIASSASTPAISDGLLYVADSAGNVYCFDAKTGKRFWTHQCAPVWSSPVIADGKVYFGTSRGLLIFVHSKTKTLLSECATDQEFAASPAIANGTIFVASTKYLYALQAGQAGGLISANHEDAKAPQK